MIPIHSFRVSMEKSASEINYKVAAGVLRGLSKTIQFAGRHPFFTLGTIGAVDGAGALAKNVLPAYTLINEQRKRDIMLGQENYLAEIANSVQRPEPMYQQPMAIEPLA